MAREFFVPKRFSPERQNIITIASSIMQRMSRQGYDLSVRQLYYQFVAHHGLENREESYALLSNVISDARDAGLLDWSVMVDRGRIPHILRTWDDPADMLRWSAEQYRIERWEQPALLRRGHG
jgi:hypothetical protein